MKKSTLNFVIDIIMLLCFSATAGIGFLLKYALIPWQDRWEVYGRKVGLSFWGMDRHQWKEIHLIFGFMLLALLFLHIVLHWKLITCIYHRITKGKRIRAILIISTIVFSLFLMLAPFWIIPKVEPIICHRKRMHLTKSSGKRNINYTRPICAIKGCMTIKEVSEQYKIPLDYIKTELELPTHTPNEEKLSTLRKKHGIKRSSIQRVIHQYRQKKN